METLTVIQTVAFFAISVVVITLTFVAALGKKKSKYKGWWHRDNVKDIAKWFFIALFISTLVGGAIYHLK